MTVTKEVQEKNWPVIKQFLKQYQNVPKKTSNNYKAAYFGDPSKLIPITGPNVDNEALPLFERVLFSSADDRLLKDLESHHYWWRKQNRIVTNRIYSEILRPIYSIISNPYITFGQNSLFNGNEENILRAVGVCHEDYLLKLREDAEGRFDEKRNWSESIGSGGDISAVGNYLWQCCPADSNASWLRVYSWRARIHAIRDSWDIDPTQMIWATDRFLAADWGRKHPENLDPRILRLCRLICETFESSEAPKPLKQYFQELIANGADEYEKTFLPGKKVTVVVRYDTAEQLQAMLPQLNPETRFPFSGDDLKATIFLPRERFDGEARQSTDLIDSHWENGTRYSSHKIIDSKTLLVHPTPSLRYAREYITGLPCDATDLATKYAAKYRLPHDDHKFERMVHSVIIGDTPEEWQVTKVRRLGELHIDSTPEIKKLVTGCRTEEDAALRLLEADAQKVLETCFDESARQRENQC